MSNDHAKDRYAPPAVGSDFDKDYFGDVNIGEVFRLRPDNKAKSFRKVKDGVAFELYWAEFNHNDIQRETVGYA